MSGLDYNVCSRSTQLFYINIIGRPCYILPLLRRSRDPLEHHDEALTTSPLDPYNHACMGHCMLPHGPGA